MSDKVERKPIQVKAHSFEEVLQSLTEKARLAEETHQQNGGMCQNCDKEKAEYQNGFNPYHCAKCNEETLKIVKQLQKGGGFSVLRGAKPLSFEGDSSERR